MTSTNTAHTSGDELDDILNGIAAEGDHVHLRAEPSISRATNDTNAGLGIDEEISVIRKRVPIPKLDDVRLRSEPGIPRLRKISKERLRFKGKGHEYGDIARMLNMYQLWLDDLYPRAKFADALAIIEKVGHTKRMQVDRKAWIDEGKPRRNVGQDEDVVDAVFSDETPGQAQREGREAIETGANAAEIQRASATPSQPHDRSHPAATEEPDEDELDALLAESAQPDVLIPETLPSRSVPAQDDPFADEMEAMEAMDDMW